MTALPSHPATSRSADARKFRRLVIGLTIPLLAALAGVVISLAQGPKKLGFETGVMEGWPGPVLMFSGGIVVFYIVMILLAILQRSLDRG